MRSKVECIGKHGASDVPNHICEVWNKGDWFDTLTTRYNTTLHKCYHCDADIFARYVCLAYLLYKLDVKVKYE
jgi:hypothetical protein